MISQNSSRLSMSNPSPMPCRSLFQACPSPNLSIPSHPLLLILPSLLIQLPQPLHQLPPQEATQPQNPLARNNPIRPTPLIPPRPIHKLPHPINLQTPKNILRPRHAPKIRRIPLVRDVDIPPSSRAAHASLRRRPASPIAARPAAGAELAGAAVAFLHISLFLLREEDAAAAEGGAGLGGVERGLRLDVRVIGGVFLYDPVQDVEELGVFDEVVGVGRDLGRGADGEGGDGRGVGEEGEELGAGGGLVVDVL